MFKTVFVSTAIPYVNAAPHIGHALEYVQADVLARYYRQRDYQVFFSSGADENALKTVQSAEKENLTPQQIADKYAQPFEAFKVLLNISYDRFIRTSQPFHHHGSAEFWNRCQADIYKKDYEGLYCVGCEEFKLPKDLDAEGNCPDHKKKPDLVKETNYFFNLKKYQTYLEELISSNTLKITPDERKNEVLSFIRGGLEDFSISRSKERAKGWGIPVPDDPDQYMYVWFDALLNYITTLGFPDETGDYKTFWADNPNRFHVIGKGISRFHAIYWPAMLKSAGLPVPTQEFVHGYITVNGEKISKSLGNVISPTEVVEKYGVDPVRYYLLKEIHPFQDGDFSFDRFEEVYNADLANGLGNLVQRVAKLCEKHSLVAPASITASNYNPEIAKHLEQFEFHLALEKVWKLIQTADRFVNDHKPWTLDTEAATPVLTQLILDLQTIATQLKPFLPKTADRILETFYGKISTPQVPLFPRLEIKGAR